MKQARPASDNTHSCDFNKLVFSRGTQSLETNNFRENGPVDFYKVDINDDDASLMKENGQLHHHYHQCSLISLFRSVSGPGLVVSRKRWSKMMKSYNGNRKKASKPSVKVVAPSFNVIHQNIPGNKNSQTVGKFIEQLLKRFHPALLFLSEVNPDLVEANIPQGYKFHRGTLRDHDLVRVCVLIKVTLPYEIENLNLDVPTVVVKIAGWRFMGCYREWTFGADPETRQRRDLELLRLKTLVKWWRAHSRGKMLVMGDMNFDPNAPTTQHQRSLNEIRGIMEDQITNRGWEQLVTEVTRTQGADEPAVLDHIYVNQQDFVEHVFNEVVTGSDHYAVGVKIRLHAPIFMAKTFFCRSIKGIKPGEFERVFSTSRIYEVYQAPDINTAMDILEFKIVRTLNIVAPIKRVTPREKYAKWLTPELQVKVKRRNAMRKKAEETKKMEDWNVFKGYQRVLAKELRAARQADFKADMDVKDAKQRWKVVRQHAGFKNKTGENNIELVVDGEKVDEPNKVAHTLNNYFKDKVVNLQKDLDVSVKDSLSYTDEYLADKEVTPVEFEQVSRKYVRNVIKCLRNTGAMGRDGISTEVIKTYSNVLTGPITHIVNLAIHHGVYPDNWKLGVITPLPKGGSPTDMKNWRPICINTAMSKVLETVLNDQISAHMEKTGLYSKTQHAYRKVRSVTTALIELDTIVRDHLNKGRTVAILTTDVSAGFNLVSKQILVPKMARFGFGAKSCKLLNNYLTGRRTKVKVKNVTSSEVCIMTGVGEGSVLGPNFFSCGMTDISVVSRRVQKKLKEYYNMDSFITQIEYADDTTGVIACENERELQIAVDELLAGFGRFYSANGLKLNESKCHVLVVRPHKQYMTIKCAGQDEVDCIKLLGLHIDNKLTYEKHANVVNGRLAGKLTALERLKGKASFKTMKEVVTSHILSTIEFCAEIYLRSPSNQSLIQKKLNTAMRLLLDEEWDASVSNMLSSLDWLNVANMWHWCCIRTLKRIMDYSSQTPYVWEILDLNIRNLMHSYAFRYNSLKITWKRLTKWSRESFVYNAQWVYNKLGLHGMKFKTYETMRDHIKMLIRTEFGNDNIT